MTREEFESTLIRSPQRGCSGEAVFDFRRVPQAAMPEFRYSTCYEWDDNGTAMDECWMAYLDAAEADWID